MNQQSSVQEISITRNSTSLTLGIISIILAVLALLVSWIPFLGLIAIPGAAVAILLASIGVLVALFKGGRGIAMPLVGGVLGVLPIVIAIGSTGATSTAISQAAQQVSETNAAKLDNASAGLTIENVKWSIDESLGRSVIVVSYQLRNSSEMTISGVTTRVRFLAEDGTEISSQRELPVSILDPDMRPGNVVQQNGNVFTYSDVPTSLVKSVEISIEDIDVR